MPIRTWDWRRNRLYAIGECEVAHDGMLEGEFRFTGDGEYIENMRLSPKGWHLYDVSETDAAGSSYRLPLIQYGTRALNGRRMEERGCGNMFHGTAGTLIVDRSSYEVAPEMKPRDPKPDRWDPMEDLLSSLRGERKQRQRPELVPACEPLKKTNNQIEPSAQEAHVRHFFDSVRSPKLPNADVEIGHRSVTACHPGAISYKVGRRVAWDARRETIPGDPEAQRLLSKRYRAPWGLPKVRTEGWIR